MKIFFKYVFIYYHNHMVLNYFTLTRNISTFQKMSLKRIKSILMLSEDILVPVAF